MSLFPSAGFSPLLQAEPRRRLFLSLFYANLLWFQVSYSQRSLGTFGPCVDLPLPYTPVGLTFSGPLRQPGAEITVASESPASLHFYAISDSGRIVKTGSAVLSLPCHELATADLDGDGWSEFVGLSPEGENILVLNRRGTARTEQSIPLGIHAQRFLLADIDNDGKKDILLYGKSAAGVTVLRGSGGGSFVQGPVLFQEVSASGLAVIDLNGDGIADVFLLNWLSNQLVVFFGISRGVFSEQVTVGLEAEPADLAITEVGRRRLVKIAVTLPEQKTITVFSGNAAGEFTPSASIQCPGMPTSVAFARLNADPIPDLIASTDKGIMTALGTSATEYALPVAYGVGFPGRLWKVTDLDGDKQADLMLIDQTSRRLVAVGNAESRSKVLWPEEYAVGVTPHGVCLTDVNGDGRSDIVVANSGSSSISVLLNRGNGTMSGQISYSVPEFPALVQTISGMDPPGGTVVTSHPRLDKIAVVRLNRENMPGGFTVIQAGNQPHVLYAAGNPSMGSLKILVRHSSARSVSFSLFEQISIRQFLEKSFRTEFPHKIRFLSSGDLRGTGNTDIVFATTDRSAGQVTVSAAPGTDVSSYKGFKTLFTIPDSLNAARFILCTERDDIGASDVLLGMGPPRNALAIAFRGERGDAGRPLTWVEGIHAARDESVIFRDLDGDGLRDLLVLDAERGEVLALYGLEGGQFTPPIVLCRARSGSAMAVKALGAEGALDLVLTDAERGTVSMHHAPFRNRQNGNP